MAITQEKAEVIAQCFANTGFLNKSLALRNAGYSANYAKAFGLKLFDNVRVKAEIDRIKAKLDEKVNVSIESQLRDTLRFRKLAEDKENMQAIGTFNDQINRNVGFYDKDNLSRRDQFVLVFNHKPEYKAKQVESEAKDTRV